MTTQTRDNETIVIFRIDPNNRVMALLPNNQHNQRLCQSYTIADEHAGADYKAVIDKTRPATPDEYEETRRMMEGYYGYNLIIRRRYVPRKAQA